MKLTVYFDQALLDTYPKVVAHNHVHKKFTQGYKYYVWERGEKEPKLPQPAK